MPNFNFALGDLPFQVFSTPMSVKELAGLDSSSLDERSDIRDNSRCRCAHPGYGCYRKRSFEHWRRRVVRLDDAERPAPLNLTLTSLSTECRPSVIATTASWL